MPKEDVLSKLPQFMSEMRGFAAEVRVFINDQVQFNDFLRENIVLKDDLKEELKNFATKDEFNALRVEVGSLRGEVRVIDERTQRIETDVKILKKNTFEDLNAMGRDIIQLKERVSLA